MKNNDGQKLLSWLLTAGMLASLTPTAALAAGDDQPDLSSLPTLAAPADDQDTANAEDTDQPDVEIEVEDTEDEAEAEDTALYAGENNNGIATHSAVTWNDTTTDFYLNNGDTVDGYEFKNTSPVTIHVSGTVTVNGRLRAANSMGGLTIVGNGAGQSTLKFTSTGSESACLMAGTSTSLTVQNITIDSSECPETVTNSSGRTQDVSVIYAFSPLSLENVTVKKKGQQNLYVDSKGSLTLKGDIDLAGMSMPYYDKSEGGIKFDHANIKSSIVVSHIRVNDIKINGESVDLSTTPFKIVEGASYRDFERLTAYGQDGVGADDYEVNTYYDNGNIYIYKGEASAFPYTAYGVYLGEASSFNSVTLDSNAKLDQNVTVNNEMTPVIIKPKARIQGLLPLTRLCKQMLPA